jgi:ABC-2 type transport system permease protein
VPELMEKVAKEIQQKAGGKFEYQVIDPDQPNAALSRKVLAERYAIPPTPVSLFSAETFYLNLLLEVDGKAQAVYPESDFTEISIRTAVESALKRNVGGFLNVVGLWTPPAPPSMFGGPAPNTWRLVREQLAREYTVRDVDLSTGRIPPEVNTLLIIGPRNLDEKARYAIDQFLMQGGSVVIAGGPYALRLDFGSPTLEQVTTGLDDLLAHYGVKVGQSLVMDPRNEPFPVEVNRNLGGITVREIQAVRYPFFVDVRPDTMDRSSPIVSRLPAVTMNFVSPIEIDAEKHKDRKVTILLRSTDQAWLRTGTDIQPNFAVNPEFGFPVEGSASPIRWRWPYKGCSRASSRASPRRSRRRPRPRQRRCPG